MPQCWAMFLTALMCGVAVKPHMRRETADRKGGPDGAQGPVKYRQRVLGAKYSKHQVDLLKRCGLSHKNRGFHTSRCF